MKKRPFFLLPLPRYAFCTYNDIRWLFWLAKSTKISGVPLQQVAARLAFRSIEVSVP
jgi:hypothetical protein